MEDRRLLAACPASDAASLEACIQGVNSGADNAINVTAFIRLQHNVDPVFNPVTVSGPAGAVPQAGIQRDPTGDASIGLLLLGAGSQVQNLAFGGFQGNGGVGLMLAGDGGDIVQGSYFGFGLGDASSFGPLPNNEGLVIGGSGSNLIGGTMVTTALSNVIANNASYGMEIQSGATKNHILGNFIGTDLSDTPGEGNQGAGLFVESADNTIGGTLALERNLISGGASDGILLTGATNNLIEGNYIGTKQNGIEPLPNMGAGLTITSTVASGPCTQTPRVGNTIGGAFSVAGNRAGNVISGNQGAGILITASDCNVVSGNLVGLDQTGTTAISNGNFGISASGTSNTIGGPAASDLNVISGNMGDGVQIAGTTNLVENNFVGTDRFGMSALPNIGSGVVVLNGLANTIGGRVSDPTKPTNVISGNMKSGIQIGGPLGAAMATAMETMVQGNFIGTDVTGTQPLGNATALSSGLLINAGISISAGSTNTCVGGTFMVGGTINACLGGSYLPGGKISEFRNVISANRGPAGDAVNDTAPGVSITGFDSTPALLTMNNLIAGNFIGTDWSGTLTSYRPDPLTQPVPLGNGRGVYIWGRAVNNIVGDPTPRLQPQANMFGNRNIISGNLYGGVAISDRGTTGNALYDNYIGTSVGGTLIGKVFDDNGVRYGNGEGVDIFDAATANLVGGYIRPYQDDSVVPPDTSLNSGDVYGHGNLIAGNLREGVRIYDSNTSQNLVQGNRIGNFLDPTDGIDKPLVNLVNGQFIGQTIGVALAGFSSGNEIGGTAMDTLVIGGTMVQYIIPAGNIISGNTIYGVAFHDSRTYGNLVDGNMIGPDLTGKRAVLYRDVPNDIDYPVQPYGAAFYNGAGNAVFQLGNTLGGTTSLTRNIITGNVHDGVIIFGTPDPLDDEALPQYNVVLGNYIGTNIDGTDYLKDPYRLPQLVNVGNGGNGINIYFNAHDNTIGGTAPALHNLITGNPLDGILIDSEAYNTVIEGNWIGLDARGLRFLNGPGNGLNGIEVNLGHNDPLPPHDNTIGGILMDINNHALESGNVISANTLDGILIAAGSTNNVIQGNYIGTDISGNLRFGRTDLGNGTTPDTNGVYYNGIHILGAGTNQNTIGGLLDDDPNHVPGNTIGFNGNDGVLIDTGILNPIWSNNIGRDQDNNDPGAVADPGIDLINGGNDMAAHPDTSWITLANYDAASGFLTFTGSVPMSFGLMPNTTYILHFFLNSDIYRPASGLGEGELFSGGILLVTDDTGAAVIDPMAARFNVGPLPTNYYYWVTMTLTYPNPNMDPNHPWGDTSDFSDNMAPPSTDNVPLIGAPTPGGQGVGVVPVQPVTVSPITSLGVALVPVTGLTVRTISLGSSAPPAVQPEAAPVADTPASAADQFFTRIGRGDAAGRSHLGHPAEGMALGDLFRERTPDLFEGF